MSFKDSTACRKRSRNEWGREVISGGRTKTIKGEIVKRKLPGRHFTSI